MSTHDIEVAPGRTLCADDVGQPRGRPVLYLHGTPDSRLARHPDDQLAARLGVRLVAVDRPGFGGSIGTDDATPGRFGHDVGRLADELGIGRFALLTWSAGTLWGLGAAATLGDRVTAIAAVGALVPVEAFADADVRAAAGEGRLGQLDAADDVGARAAAELLAPLMVPDPCTPDTAREHRAETSDALARKEVASVPGAEETMVASMVEAVRQGHDGIVADRVAHLAPLDFDLGHVRAPVTLWYGSEDTTCPPAFGAWLADRLPHARLELVEGAGHLLVLPYWERIVGDLAAAVEGPL